MSEGRDARPEVGGGRSKSQLADAEEGRPERTPARRVDLVTGPNFLLATRDSGYKHSSLVVAELIDNAIQAGATDVDIRVHRATDSEYPLEICVIDDGRGMDALTLSRALSFGGTTRFNDRRSLGRYGMGLPNGGLSRARRIEVFSWRNESTLYAWLDIDEWIAKKRRSLPQVQLVPRPDFLPSSGCGTAVRLVRCDRLEYRRASALTRRLSTDLRRIYRHYLSSGVTLRVDGDPLSPSDPLLLDAGGEQFGDELRYMLEGPQGVGTVSVRFSELPIEAWHHLPPEEKRRRGVTGAPSVSVVRANREVDRGWLLMGDKRRENYDDWWRCEIHFDPRLDEMFGITNSKQAIRPSAFIRDVLEPDLEAVARALNQRVRRRFELLKVSKPIGEAMAEAAKAYRRLPALPQAYGEKAAAADNSASRGRHSSPVRGPYEILVGESETADAFEFSVANSQLTLVLNSRHPFYRDLYEPLANSEAARDRTLASRVALVLLAAAHTEAISGRQPTSAESPHARAVWADIVAAFFNA